jgi:hypothetical protein
MPERDSCEACKQRKVKCGEWNAPSSHEEGTDNAKDRQQPICGWCARNDNKCEYKERKKPGLRAGYGRELESRLDRLEEIIQQQGQQLADHLQRSCSVADQGSVQVGPGALPNGSRQTSMHGETFQIHPQLFQATSDPSHRASIDTPMAQVASNQQFQFQPMPDPMQEQQRHGSMHEPAPSHYTPSVHSFTSPTAHGGAFQSPTIQTDANSHLPPYDLLYGLVDLYFKHINSWLPLLDRKTTLDTLFGPTPLDDADRVLLHAIVATSLRFSKDPRLTPESRMQYHESSKQRVQLYGLETSSVRALQALVILALDVTGTTNGPPGWNLLALIVRSLVQLGLAVESTSTIATPMYPSIALLRAAVLPEPKSFVEDEERRRLFWAVYLLDRYATIATAFEFALNEKEIDRKLPCRDDLFAANKVLDTKWFRSTENNRYIAGMADNLGPFSYYCELLGILTRIHQFLKRPVDISSPADVEVWQQNYRTLDSELNTWHFNLPDEFANLTRVIESGNNGRSASCQWIMLYAAYHFNVIRMNSSAAYPSSTSPIFTSSYSAMQRCLTAVYNLRQLCQFVVNNGMLDKLGPPFAFSIWVGARVLLVHGSTMDHEVDPEIGLFVSTLAEIGQYWEVARRYSEILTRVLQEYRQSLRTVDVKGERVTPSTVKILADMRRYVSASELRLAIMLSLCPSLVLSLILMLYRCAYDLDFLISRQPNTVIKSIHPTRANSPAPNELEYLDVFDLFNFPRLPNGADVAPNETNEVPNQMPPEIHDMNNALNFMNFAVPNPETDWLYNAS